MPTPRHDVFARSLRKAQLGATPAREIRSCDCAPSSRFLGRLSREPLVNSGASLQNCKLDPARGASVARRPCPMYASSAYFCFRTEARKCEGILFPRSHPQQLCFAAWSFEFPTWQKNCQYSSITLSFFSLTWLREHEEEEAALMPRLEFGISFCKPQIWEGTPRPPFRFNPSWESGTFEVRACMLALTLLFLQGHICQRKDEDRRKERTTTDERIGK